MTKVCRHCGETKASTEFFRSAKYSDGLQFWCKECQRRARSGRVEHRNHGESRTKLYRTWKAMRWRCSPANWRHASWYFEKGIYVCPEWDRFLTFQEWALNNGYAPDLSIDRVDDEGPYAPGNCRWITLAENARRAHAGKGVKA